MNRAASIKRFSSRSVIAASALSGVLSDSLYHSAFSFLALSLGGVFGRTERYSGGRFLFRVLERDSSVRFSVWHNPAIPPSCPLPVFYEHNVFCAAAVAKSSDGSG